MAKTVKADKADNALALKRVDDILRIRLDGARFWDVREFVRENESDPKSNWFVPEGAKPLEDKTIRNYMTRADALMLTTSARSRQKLKNRHLNQRRHIYAKAMTSGDYRTALAALQDEAKLLGLYPESGIDEAAVKQRAFVFININRSERSSDPGYVPPPLVKVPVITTKPHEQDSEDAEEAEEAEASETPDAGAG